MSSEQCALCGNRYPVGNINNTFFSQLYGFRTGEGTEAGTKRGAAAGGHAAATSVCGRRWLGARAAMLGVQGETWCLTAT